MAKLLWGKVYFQNTFAGFLEQEPSGGTSFSYDQSYLDTSLPAIAHTLPLQNQPDICNTGIHPFFDNLVAEGWLEQAQTRLLGKRIASRFELLLAFGTDCAGAVSVIDPEPVALSSDLLDINDAKEMAVLSARASLSGVQPKLALIKRGNKYTPAKFGELSTHIAKFPSATHTNILHNEYLTTIAFNALLPEDEVIKLFIGSIEGQSEEALIIKRFDRQPEGRIYFEEFNQLLGNHSWAKYNGGYKDMADFIHNTKGCLVVENYRLFARILAGFLLGNTDMHLKNFAMIHTENGLALSPSYDFIAANLYQYKTLALAISNTNNLTLSHLKAKHIILLGKEFTLSNTAIMSIVSQFEKNKEAAKQMMFEASIGSLSLKNTLIKMMDKRWNGTFALIGKHLLQKR